ncbi:MAG: hypothetical protein LQ342_000149 [Letrouitia transgressa]|nr:MAG: hypothetical protein LQ342_000149 [Letrouitia transgressa]
MPSFYPTIIPYQTPLTPPEYYDDLSESIVGTSQAPLAMISSQRALATPINTGVCEGRTFAKQHSQPRGLPASQEPYSRKVDHQPLTQSHPWLGQSTGSYKPNVMSSLPPIQMPEVSSRDFSKVGERRSRPVPQSKDEKIVGGVAAYLDYEIDQMADFVSEMAQGMYHLYQSRICLADIDMIRSVNPKSMVSSALRKYVAQVLSSTRLPSSTILLGLHYLAARMRMLSSGGRYATGNGELPRMLITSLLLGSKFLDDNTFQNRSWSEVSNIAVTELNAMEIEWLVALGWDMHINLEDPQGFSLWHQHWDQWQTTRFEMSMDSLKLTPLNVNVQRQRSKTTKLSTVIGQQSSNYDLPLDINLGINKLTSQWQTSQYNQWPISRPKVEQQSTSASGISPVTPHWFDNSENQEYLQRQSQYSRQSLLSSGGHALTQNQSFHRISFSQSYAYHKWNEQNMVCGCGYCASHRDQYAMAPGLGPQPIVS